MLLRRRRSVLRAIQEGLVDINSLVEFRGGTRRSRPGRAKARRNAIPCHRRGWIERAVIGDIIECADGSGEPPLTSAINPGNESDGFDVEVSR